MLLKILQSVTTTSDCCLNLYYCCGGRTHAPQNTCTNTSTYTQTQAHAHAHTPTRVHTAPLNYAQFVGSLFIGSLRFLLFLRALTHDKHKHKHTNIHYYAGYLLFVIVEFPAVVALAVNVSVLLRQNMRYVLRIFPLSCLALRCVAHKSRKQTEARVVDSSSRGSSRSSTLLTFAAIAQFNQNKFNTYAVHCASHLTELK